MSETLLNSLAIDESRFRQPLKRRIRFALRDAAAMTLLPLAKLDSRAGRHISILSYHRVLPDFPPGSSRSGNVAPYDFASQIGFLQKEKYRILSLDEFYRIQSGEMETPQKAAMITFDDGYADNLLSAHAIGKRMGVPINYFIPSGIIGLPEWPYDWDERTPQELWHMKRYPEMWRPLTWDEVHRMRSEGARFGLHGHMHQRLSGLTREGLMREIGEGIRVYEENMGDRPVCFSIPWGDGTAYTAEAIEVLRGHGLKAIFTTLPARTCLPHPGEIFPRLSIREHDGLGAFSRKVQGAHDVLNRLRSSLFGRGV